MHYTFFLAMHHIVVLVVVIHLSKVSLTILLSSLSAAYTLALLTFRCLPVMSKVNAPISSARPIVFFDVSIGNTPAGRLKMELFSDIVPR
jgi:hypothetical protein